MKMDECNGDYLQSEFAKGQSDCSKEAMEKPEGVRCEGATYTWQSGCVRERKLQKYGCFAKFECFAKLALRAFAGGSLDSTCVANSGCVF